MVLLFDIVGKKTWTGSRALSKVGRSCKVEGRVDCTNSRRIASPAVQLRE